MKTPISNFCDTRMTNKKIEEAFTAYCKASYSDSFRIKLEGDTITGLILRMNVADVENMWNLFVLDLRDALVG